MVRQVKFSWEEFRIRIRVWMLQFLFWAVVAILPLWAISYYLFSNMDDWENTLLDFRLEQRSQFFTPDSDIVVVGFDANTEAYVQDHPELGLTSRTIPRGRLVTMIHYLKAQGAKAIILDTDLDTSSPDDAALASALHRMKAYGVINLRDNQNLDKFIDRQRKNFQDRGEEYLQNAVIYNLYIKPYLYKKVLFNRYVLGFPYTSWYEAGFWGANKKQFPPVTSLMRTLQELNLRAENDKQALFPGLPVYRPVASDDVYKDLFMNQCTEGEYTLHYPANSPFLTRLMEEGLWVRQYDSLPDHKDRTHTFCHVPPLDEPLLSSFKGLGFAPPTKEDEVVREAPILMRAYGGRFYTSPGVRPVLDFLKIKNIGYSNDTLHIGERHFYSQNGFGILINWRHPRLLAEKIAVETQGPLNEATRNRIHNEVKPSRNNKILGGGHLYRTVSAIDLLRKVENRPASQNDPLDTLYKFPGEPRSGWFSFKNKIVIFGDMVAESRQTPMSPITYRPEITATVLDMMLHDNSNIRMLPGTWVTIITALLCISIFVLVIWVFRKGLVAALFLISLYWVANFILFNGVSSLFQEHIQTSLPAALKTGLYLPLIQPTMAFAFSLIASSIWFYFLHDREKRQLTHVFSNYVSPQVMQHIVKDPEKALENLKGTRKELTVMFTDLKGFTSRFEHTDAEIMVYQLNEYFDEMTNVILRHGGTYDKYMGDAIMAFFGAPFEVPNHAEQACAAALEMQTALRYLNAQWQEAGLQPLEHGIGISSGDMFVGNFGSKKIKNFTVLGSNVNLGARLEAYTREAGVPIVISQRTRDLAGHTIKVRDLGMINVKGFRDAVQVYGLMQHIKINVPGATAVSSWGQKP